MKITELLESFPTMQQLIGRKLPGKLSYALAKNIKMINSEIEIFDQTRLKLLSENWPLNKDTNKYDVPPEDQEKWQAMYKELAEQEVKIDPYMVDKSIIDGIEGISPAEVMAILWMIKEA